MLFFVFFNLSESGDDDASESGSKTKDEVVVTTGINTLTSHVSDYIPTSTVSSLFMYFSRGGRDEEDLTGYQKWSECEPH